MYAAEKQARLSEAGQTNARVRQLEQDINEHLSWAANPAVSKIAVFLMERTLRIIVKESEQSVEEEPTAFSVTALSSPLKVEVA